MDLDTKELEGRIEALSKELAEAKAVKVATPADVEAVKTENKALQDAVKGLEARLKKLEDAPAPAKTQAPSGESELVMI
jgi:predicted  nucleic acid-binding Zn-ribbon protein